MKNLFLFFTLLILSFVSNAQISAFNNANYDLFYGIGGYSFSQQYFTSGVRPNPDVVTGPSPQNDFTYTVSADGGIQHVLNYISTLSVNKSITFEFKNNNVKKFGCRVSAVNIPTGQSMADLIVLEATTNLGNVITTTGSQTDFVGFNVMGGENEYITTITATFQSPSTNSIAINSITIGDNTPQNVALSFDGVDDYVSIPNNVGNFSTNQDFTVTCWFRPDASLATEQNLVNKWSGSGGYAFILRYYGSSGTILAGQYDGTNFPYIQSTTNLKDGKWHHVAFVKSGNNLLLYIDGIQEGGTITDTATGLTTNSTALQIGREATGTKYFKGEIDEIRIWNIGKTATEIANERFCKTPNNTNLEAFYNFNNGVPHGNNALIMQVQNDISTYHGTLNNFDKTGDVSNFVTGEVKYVNIEAGDGNYSGSSWSNGFLYLQDALVSNACNDLFEVYVAKSPSVSAYKPSTSGNRDDFFNISKGMRVYGGFAGTEKSINHRNLALIHTTNETTLTGDLASNDILSDFFQNRSDNSKKVVQIYNKSNILIDGFSIRGGNSGDYGGGIDVSKSQNISVKNCKIYDNRAPYGGGVDATGANNLIFSNCTFLGNRANYYGDALYLG